MNGREKIASAERQRTARDRRLSKDLMLRALAVELGHSSIDRSLAGLMIPQALSREVRHLVRGLSREDLITVVGHLSLMVRYFADNVPVAERDQLLAALDAADLAADQGAAS